MSNMPSAVTGACGRADVCSHAVPCLSPQACVKLGGIWEALTDPVEASELTRRPGSLFTSNPNAGWDVPEKQNPRENEEGPETIPLFSDRGLFR